VAGGARLVEAQLARDLGTSRGPVREALRRLSDEGLADVQPRRGVVVRDLTSDDVRAISDFRIGIETMAARLAVRRGAPTAGLRRIVVELGSAADREDEARVVELDFEFHAEICRSAENAYLLAAFKTIEAQIRGFVALGDAVYADLTALTPEHLDVIASLDQDDEEFADRVVREHIASGAGRLLRGR
jgi:DNA-binding GntR family transcriptional regulator